MSEFSTRATVSRARPPTVPVRMQGHAAATFEPSRASSDSPAALPAAIGGAMRAHHASSDSVASLDASKSSQSMQDFIDREIQRCFPDTELPFPFDDEAPEASSNLLTGEPIVGRTLAHLLAGQAPDVVANLHSALMAQGFAAGQGLIRENSQHVFEVLLSSSEPLKTIKRRKLPPRPPVDAELLKKREALNAQPIDKILEFIDGPASSAKAAPARGGGMNEPSSRKAQIRRERRLRVAASARGSSAGSVASSTDSSADVAQTITASNVGRPAGVSTVEKPPPPSAVIAQILQQRFPQGYMRPQTRMAAAANLPPALRELYTKFGELESSSHPSWPGAVWRGLRYAEGPDRAFPVPVQKTPPALATHEVLKSARMVLEGTSIWPGFVLDALAGKLSAPLDDLGSFTGSYVLSGDVRQTIQAVSQLPRASQLPILYSALYRVLKYNAGISNPVVNLLADAAQRNLIRQHAKYAALSPAA